MNSATRRPGRILSIHLLPRVVAGALFVVVAAGAWDVWWHGAVGRDSFWEPPHILLQAGVLAALAASAYGWLQTRARRWKSLAVAAVLVPLSAPFDELWHRAFGVENVSSPLIVWSPPHLALVGALIAAFLLVLPLLRTDDDALARAVFMSVAFAAVLELLLFLAFPLEPLGPYHLVGFAGAMLPALFLALILLTARLLSPQVGSATMTTVFFIALGALTFGERLAPGVVVPPHGHPPPWLTVFSFALPALVVDLVDDRWPRLITGGLIGLLSAAVLYGFSSDFLDAPFRYGASSAGLAVVVSVLGGGAGGLLAARLARSLSGHLHGTPEGVG